MQLFLYFQIRKIHQIELWVRLSWLSIVQSLSCLHSPSFWLAVWFCWLCKLICSRRTGSFVLLAHLLLDQESWCLAFLLDGWWLSVWANVFFLLFNHEAEDQFLFCSGQISWRRLLKSWSGLRCSLRRYWRPIRQIPIFRNHDRFFGLGVTGFYICDSFPQVAETRFRVRTFGGWLRGLLTSGLAVVVPACVLGRLEAGCDDGMSSSESELFCSGDLIGGIGDVWLSLISASMAMTELSSIVAIEFW